MRHLATVLLVLALAPSAFAGTNPDCQVCIDFSGTATSWDDVQSRVNPEPYTICPDPVGGEDDYCIWMHGGVGKPALEGDEGCYPVVPVEDTSWGAIKALYR